MSEKLIIFPSSRQLTFLVQQPVYREKIHILLHHQKMPETEIPCCLDFFTKENTEQIKQLQRKELFVLCCHEEAVYWLKQHDSPKWHLQFSHKYLYLLEKQNFKDFLNQNYIRNAVYTTSPEKIISYPAVAKPSIGFGSIGVCTVFSFTEAKQYAEAFPTMLANSVIYAYQKQYFPDARNLCLFETKTEGIFFRTPVIILKAVCEHIFPVQGITRICKKNSEYHWEEFELNLTDESINFQQMTQIMNQLIISLSLEDGIYIAEFMQEKDGRISLLEFSPRQTSERISYLVKLASGIDLEWEVLSMFLYHKTAISFPEKTKTVRLRIESHTGQFPPLPEIYHLLETENDRSLYDKQCKLKYFIKDSI